MLAKTTTHRQRYWLKHVEAADLSDSTIAQYAAAHDVSLKGLYQWKTKLMKLKLYQPATSPPKPEFVPVKPSQSTQHKKVVPPLDVEPSGCTVTLANGTRIEFHGELSAVVIRSIMTTVSQVR